MNWLLHTFVATSLLMLLVLALRGPVARLFGAGWAYALWLIPAFRLVLPPLPLPAQGLPPSVAVLIPAASDMAAPLPASAGPGQWVPFLLACWAGGAAIFIILQWLGYRAFLRRLSGSARPARPARYGGIATFVSRMVEGPLALGLIEPRIFLPTDFSRRYSPGERRLAMEHELTHHRHRDIWWNMAATAVLATNWFNPLAWLAYRAFRADQELACDAAVATRATIEERCDYARALVKSATGPALIAACPINGAGTLKRRLRMLRVHRASPARSAGGMAALTVLAVAGATSATLREAPAEIPQLIEAAATMPAAFVAAPVHAAAPALTAPIAAPKHRAFARVRHAAPAAMEMADAKDATAEVPKIDLPPFATQMAAAEAEDAPRPRTIVLAAAPAVADMPEEAVAPAAPHMRYAVSFSFTARQLERLTGWQAKHKRTIYRVGDPRAAQLIEAEVRKALQEAQETQEQARRSVRVAQLVRTAGGGSWAKLNLQIVEQGD
ncbi:MAG TPA: M56 family metallopeptidase [Allosphingosinicella sp.]|jgi:beta-lactamase regulating signal transducer with metallopeptidase domain|nr:M56 family metallopeptidase [Allosphingosinicella sp.]